jgi:hypothetical protein
VPVTLELPLLMIVFFSLASLAIGAGLLPGLVLLSTALRLFRIRPTQLDTRGDDAHNDCQAVQMPLHFVKRSISSRAYA